MGNESMGSGAFSSALLQKASIACVWLRIVAMKA
jgi:hypothetical protein